MPRIVTMAFALGKQIYSEKEEMEIRKMRARMRTRGQRREIGLNSGIEPSIHLPSSNFFSGREKFTLSLNCAFYGERCTSSVVRKDLQNIWNWNQACTQALRNDRGAVVNGKPMTFVHSLLFRCRECQEPLPLCVVATERNGEKIDGNSYDLSCNCGWSKGVLGMQAIRHWVVPWSNGEEEKGESA
jgi:hypothetical protein